MSDTLAQDIRHLAQCRQIQAECQKEKDAIMNTIKEQFGETLERADSLLATAKTDTMNAEENTRCKALAIYYDTANKKPHSAVQVKMFTVLEYSPDAALNYARLHLPQALKLDKRTFEKVAKAASLDFVQANKRPKVTIARDLSGYVENVTQEEHNE
jgi:hypothetical protein